jgi:hypothetical protein
MTIARQLKITTFPFDIKNEQGKLIYTELSNGYWCIWEYDQDGNVIYTKDSDGYILDKRPKPEPEPKRETLEEAARRYTESTTDNDAIRIFSFIEGAKWQAERMYSEEEVIKAYHDAYHKGYRVGQKDAESHPLALTIANNMHIDRNKWFEQFKKKGGDK